MWPFRRDPIPRLVAEASSPKASDDARRRAFNALCELPPDPRALDCFVRLATGEGVDRMLQAEAIAAINMTPPPLGTRALLQLLGSDAWGGAALERLAKPPHLDAVVGLAAEALPALEGIVERMGAWQPDGASDGYSQVEALATRLGGQAAPVLERVRTLGREHAERQVPEWRKVALTGHDELLIKRALERLTALGSPAAQAALAEFRAAAPRMVRRTVFGGIGATFRRREDEVSTRELGQRGEPTPGSV